jgi:hypothetical protein
MRWANWVTLDVGLHEDKVEKRLKFWRELNDYEVIQRGEYARSIFEAVGEEIS